MVISRGSCNGLRGNLRQYKGFSSRLSDRKKLRRYMESMRKDLRSANISKVKNEHCILTCNQGFNTYILRNS